MKTNKETLFYEFQFLSHPLRGWRTILESDPTSDRWWPLLNDSLCDVHRWTMVSSSEDVVRVTYNHFVLIGVPDHITFTNEVLSDNTWEVSVTSPRKVPAIHRLCRHCHGLLPINTPCHRCNQAESEPRAGLLVKTSPESGRQLLPAPVRAYDPPGS